MAPRERLELALPGQRISADRLAEATRRIGIPVEIDESGWRRERSTLRYTVAADLTIQAVAIRTPPDTTVAKLVELGVPARCARYNAALRELRSLQARLERLAARTMLAQGSAIWGAYQHCLQLDHTIADRQRQRMGDGQVDLDVLLDEIVYWERYHEHFASIVTRAEREPAR